MLDSNTILGITAFLECEEYKHGLLTQNIDAWPCGTPIVYPADNKAPMGNQRPTIRVFTLMPPCQSGGSIDTAQVNTQSVFPIGIKPLYKNHEVLTVNEFDIGKFGRLLEFIRDVGGISLIIESEGGREKLTKSIARLGEFFKHTSLFYFNAWPTKFLSGEDDKYVCVLTFLDLPYCVPLFNMHKVDGIGLSFSGATINVSKELGHLHRTFKSDFIYSNYEDNVFFMDGISVNSMRPPDISVYRDLDKYARLTLKVGKADKKKKSPGIVIDTEYKLEQQEHAVEWPTETEPVPPQDGELTFDPGPQLQQYTTINDNSEFIWEPNGGSILSSDQVVNDEPEEEGGN